MKIRVTDDNRERIQAALDAAQSKATARTLSVDDVLDEVAWNEEKLEQLGVPKNSRVGCRSERVEMVFDAYRAKGSPRSTSVTVERGGNDWFLTKAERVPTPYPRLGDAMTLTPRAAAAAFAELLRKNDMRVTRDRDPSQEPSQDLVVEMSR